jgi:hypothetical protein
VGRPPLSFPLFDEQASRHIFKEDDVNSFSFTNDICFMNSEPEFVNV